MTEKRRIYTAAAWLVGSDWSGVEERREARSEYRKTLLRQKKKSWDEFLAKAKKNDVWTAHQFMKVRVPNRVPGGHGATLEDTEQMIMSHFFQRNTNPSESVVARRHDIDQDGDLEFMLEVTRALTKCSNKSAAGLDQVPYGSGKV